MDVPESLLQAGGVLFWLPFCSKFCIQVEVRNMGGGGGGGGGQGGANAPHFFDGEHCPPLFGQNIASYVHCVT